MQNWNFGVDQIPQARHPPGRSSFHLFLCLFIKKVLLQDQRDQRIFIHLYQVCDHKDILQKKLVDVAHQGGEADIIHAEVTGNNTFGNNIKNIPKRFYVAGGN